MLSRKVKGVLIEGVKITNSPAWTVNPVRCNNVTIDGITIKKPADSSPLPTE